MRKVLFIGSLNTRKNHFDGERIKTTLIYECLLATGSKVTLVNLSKSKITQTLKLISLSVFFKKRFDSIIVSKDPRGGKIIEKILSFSRVPQDKILYFEIGPFLYQMLCDRDVKPELFSRNRHVIVETASMKRELEEFGFSNVLIFPNFKVRPRVEIEVKHYPKSVLRLVYFSRIEEERGFMIC